jgi:nicotinamide mononucleotide transporter
VIAWLESLLSDLVATSPWEAGAVALALAYLLLAVRRSLWCWACAFVSTAIYLVLMYRAQLYMQTALQVFYLAMAVYGYFEWRRGRDQSGRVAIARWGWRANAAAIGAIVAVSLINGWLLDRYVADAALPYVDALVTWGSVVTTYMVAKRVIENWLYWIVFDLLGAFLYFSRDLNLTGVLFLVYTVIVIQGYRAWSRDEKIAATARAVTQAV